MEYIFADKTQREHDMVLDIIRGWGSDILVTRGKIHRVEDLEGILVFADEKIAGLGLYTITGSQCEIVLLETIIQNEGIGSRLIEKIKEKAKARDCRRIWLITTNVNINALKFYQKRGFHFSNIYINAMEESRRIKPEIPLSENGIDIRDEIEFEMEI